MLSVKTMYSSVELLQCSLLMLQFTIKPLDKKKDVFKFYSSQLRVNKLVGLPAYTCRFKTITKFCEHFISKIFAALYVMSSDPAAVHW